MDDTISRAAALDALGERPVVWSDNDDYTLGERNQYDMDRLAIETVPSVSFENHDEIKSYSKDTISRQAAIEAMRKAKDKSEAHRMLVQLPSATDTNVATTQPKYDEWCTDCKEYDQERHSCPRWNRVIRQTVEDVKAAQPGCEDVVYRKAVQMLLAYFVPEERYAEAVDGLRRLPSAQPGWIPVTERLPEIHQKVILSLTDGTVIVGFQGEPDCIWQVTEKDGEKSWVYDPESYTDDIDSLPTAKDCWFDTDGPDGMSYTSITSLTHRAWCTGVAAWRPLPSPWRGDT